MRSILRNNPPTKDVKGESKKAMRFNKTTDYALRAMIEIAKADGQLSAKDVAHSLLESTDRKASGPAVLL